MAEYRVLSPADRQAFDAFIASSARPDVLQTWAWGALKETTGWRAHRILAGPAGAPPVSACTLLERGVPGLGPLLYAPRGPVVDWDDEDAAAAACAAAISFASSRRAIALKVDPAVPSSCAACARVLGAAGFRRQDAGVAFEGVQPRFVMHLRIDGKSEEDLLAGMHAKTRYNVRLATRRAVSVRAGGERDLEPFHRLLLETAARDGFAVRGLPYFRAIWRELLGKGGGWLLLGEGGGELLAGAIVFRTGATAWYVYGATSGRHRDLMPMYAVQWEAIRLARETGCRLFDFRGVSGDLREDAPLYGLYRFKRGFGAELVEYVGEWDRPLRPLAYLAMRRALPVARHVLAALRRRQAAGAPEGE